MKLLLGTPLLAVVLHCAELPLACTPNRPVANEGDSVLVSAWPPPGEWVFDWSVKTGQVESGTGRNAVWDLSGVPSGEHEINVSATRPGSSSLTCRARLFVERKTDSRGDKFSRRFILGPGQLELKNYALYSYVVLAAPGTDKEAKERNRKLLEVWKNKTLQMSALERKESTNKLNAIFVPVDQPNIDTDIAWIEKHYDYNRADRILMNVPGVHTGGPYLVASMSPLTSEKSNRILVLDASWAPPSTIEFWYSAFANQAAQERFDEPNRMDFFNLKLRTMISVLAEGLPQAKEALASIIAIGK